MLGTLSAAVPACDLTPAGARLLVDAAELRNDPAAVVALVESLASNKRSTPDPGVLVALWSSPLLLEVLVDRIAAPAGKAAELVTGLCSAQAAAAALRVLPRVCREERRRLEVTALFLHYLGTAKGVVEVELSDSDSLVLSDAARALVGNVELFGELVPVFDVKAIGYVGKLLGSVGSWAPLLRVLPRTSVGLGVAIRVWQGLDRSEEVFDLLPVLPFPSDFGSAWDAARFAAACLDRLAALLPGREARQLFDSLAAEWPGTLGELCDFARTECGS